MTRGRDVGFDGGVPRAVGPMIRWLLLGLMLVGLGFGYKRGWLVMNWERIGEDLHIPSLKDLHSPFSTDSNGQPSR
jgi:hypothetical protein